MTALDANDNKGKERVFENIPVTCIPVTRIPVTRYTGISFGNGGSGQTSMTASA